MTSTVVVTLTDAAYISRAERTIKDVRGRGCWSGPIVLVAVDFDVDSALVEKYNLIVHRVSHISCEGLKAAWATHPIRPMPDQRHTKKLAQWNKLYLFDSFFTQWNRIVYFDAGLRVLDSLDPLLDLPWEGRFLAPDDCAPADNGNRFSIQIDWTANPSVADELLHDFGPQLKKEHYFLNCMWVYDTALQQEGADFKTMETLMNKYPICLCNEMGIMNLIFAIRLRVWNALPEFTPANKYLFAWSEHNYPATRPLWHNFHFIKYPATISMNQD